MHDDHQSSSYDTEYCWWSNIPDNDFAADEETYAIDDEYLFCEKLLVAPIAAGESGRDFYLPPCGWRDYFTKEPIESGWHHIETNGIPVYERMD